MPRKKMPECCVCECDAYDAYEVNGNIYCEDCLWDELTDMDPSIHDETITLYTVGETHIEDDKEEAIKKACDYLNLKCKKIY